MMKWIWWKPLAVIVACGLVVALLLFGSKLPREFAIVTCIAVLVAVAKLSSRRAGE